MVVSGKEIEISSLLEKKSSLTGVHIWTLVY